MEVFFTLVTDTTHDPPLGARVACTATLGARVACTATLAPSGGARVVHFTVSFI